MEVVNMNTEQIGDVKKAEVLEMENIAPEPEAEKQIVDQNANEFKVSQEQGAWKNVQTFQGATFNSTVVNVINTVIGAGILSMGFCIRQGGLIGSALMILLVVASSQLTFYYTSIASVYTGCSVYGRLGSKLYNTSVGLIVDIFVILLTLGVCTAYTSILFEQVSDFMIDFFKVEASFMGSNKYWINFLVAAIVLFPLSSIKNMDNLKFTSAIAIFCVVIFVIACFYLGVKALVKEDMVYNIWPDSKEHLGTAFSIFVLSFCCHTNIPKLSDEIKFTSKTKFSNKITKMTKSGLVGYIVCALSYLLVGAFSYFAFGNTINGSVLTSLRGKSYFFIPIIKIGYALVVMFSYPLIAFVPTLTIDSMFCKGERTTTRRLVVVGIWVAATYLISQVIPSLVSIFSITGSLCGSFINYIFPALFFIRIYRLEKDKPIDQQFKGVRFTKYSVAMAWIIFAFGWIVCIWATSMEIKNILNQS